MRRDANGLEILSRDESLRLLCSVPIGRVVTTIGALPVALPVNFVMTGDCIVFRSGPGTKLFAAVRNAVVGFEVDAFDPETRTGWSVLVVGHARQATDPGDLAELARLPLDPWAPVDLPEFLCIELTQVTGRRIAASHAETAAPLGRVSA